MTTPFTRNDYKRTLLLAHLGWWGTAAFVVLRAFDVIPIAYGSIGLLTLGLGITGSLGLSRYRLAATMTEVFQIGLLAREKEAEMAIYTPLANGRADELLAHLDECAKCRTGKTTPTACDRVNELIRLTLEERHGKVDVS